jgi:hypothetical protein
MRTLRSEMATPILDGDDRPQTVLIWSWLGDRRIKPAQTFVLCAGAGVEAIVEEDAVTTRDGVHSWLPVILVHVICLMQTGYVRKALHQQATHYQGP